MKWYAISGSWRTIDEKVKEDVEKIVKEIISNNNGILTGGALGVDYIATQTILDLGDPKKQIKLYLPIHLEKFCEHYLKRAEQEIITEEQAKRVIHQLKTVKKICPDCIFDNWGFTKANKKSYYHRNTKIVQNCNGLYAFQINNDEGTQDAVDKAKKMKKPVYLKKY